MIKKPKRINKNFLNTPQMTPIKYVVIHNDYGFKQATAEWYANSFLPSHDLTAGVAHYYIDKNTIARTVDTYRQAWHTANPEGNGHAIGYEVVGSRWDNGLDTKSFKENEEMVFRQVAEDMLFYKMPVNRNTVRLHKEFSSTSCPHRSWDLHGKSVNAVKDYFISRIKHYQKLGKTVDQMIDAENKPKEKVNYASSKNPKGQSTLFVKGEMVKLHPAATEWLNYYDKVTKEGGKPHGKTKMTDKQKEAEYVVTWLPTDGSIEVAQVKDNKIQKERFKALDKDLYPFSSKQKTFRDELYAVQSGAFKDRKNAEKQAEQMKKDGYDTYITKK